MASAKLYTGKLFKLKNAKNRIQGTRTASKKPYMNREERRAWATNLIIGEDLPEIILVLDERLKKVKISNSQGACFWINKFYLGEQILTNNGTVCEILESSASKILDMCDSLDQVLEHESKEIRPEDLSHMKERLFSILTDIKEAQGKLETS